MPAPDPTNGRGGVMFSGFLIGWNKCRSFLNFAKFYIFVLYYRSGRPCADLHVSVRSRRAVR